LGGASSSEFMAGAGNLDIGGVLAGLLKNIQKEV
jgi:hypothetical protein